MPASVTDAFVPHGGCAPGCGQCCELVALKGSPESYRFLLDRFPPEAVSDDDRRNAEWIVTRMWRIPVAMAVEINARRVAQNPHNRFYLCSAFNAETRQCMAYEQRPPFCRVFPWAGRSPTNPEVLGGLGPFSRCGYWHDVPRADWPAWADPLPAPGQPANCC